MTKTNVDVENCRNSFCRSLARSSRRFKKKISSEICVWFSLNSLMINCLLLINQGSLFQLENFAFDCQLWKERTKTFVLK